MLPLRMMTERQEYEVCRIMVGIKKRRAMLARFLGKSYKGKRSSVEFSWRSVMRREERFGDVVGFYHTHPGSSPTPSERDVRTLNAWVIAFGKPMLCAIRSGKRWGFYLFSEDGYRTVLVRRIGKSFIWKG